MIAQASGSGHGKAILVGEHHVLDGATALALGLPGFDTRVTLRRSGGDGAGLVLEPGPAPLADDTLRMLTTACSLAGLRGCVAVDIASTVPISRGLGSSAALAVAAVQAAQALAGGAPLDEAERLRRARAVEDLVHGKSSGLDPAAASAAGAVLYARGAVLGRVTPRGERLERARWLLLDLGASVPTREAIAVAQAARERLGPARVRDLNERTTAAAQAAAQALATDALADLAAALREAAAALEPLGVVDEAMRSVLQLAVSRGALAAKQTGAGLGGMLLALAPDAATAEAICAAVRGHTTGAWILPVVPEPASPSATAPAQPPPSNLQEPSR